MPKSTKSKSKKLTKSSMSRLLGRRFYTVMFVCLFAAVGTYVLSQAFAATGQIYITPPATTIQQGEVFNVSVRILPSTSIDAVEATVSYDASVLEYVSTDGSASPFNVQLISSGGGGSVKIARGTFNTPISSDSLIVNITFRAQTVTEASQITVTGNATYQGTYTNPALLGSVIKITSPLPPPPVGDVSAPLVTVIQPQEGASPTKGKLTIQATASDDSQTISKMEIYIDGSIMQTSTTSSINYTWVTKSRRIASGSHVVTVKAYDLTGNVGSKTINVTK